MPTFRRRRPTPAAGRPCDASTAPTSRCGLGGRLFVRVDRRLSALIFKTEVARSCPSCCRRRMPPPQPKRRWRLRRRPRRCKVFRCAFKVRTKAAIEESRRCCRPTKASFASAAFCAGQRSDAASRAAHRMPRAGAIGRVRAHHPARPAIGIGFDFALRECLTKAAQVRLQTTHHDWLEVLRARLNATREALRVEHLEQRREAVGMAIVRRGSQKQPVLKALG